MGSVKSSSAPMKMHGVTVALVALFSGAVLSILTAPDPLLVAAVEGAKFDFYNTVLPPLTQISRRHGMFAPGQTPAIGPPGDGRAYIQLDGALPTVDGSATSPPDSVSSRP